MANNWRWRGGERLGLKFMEKKKQKDRSVRFTRNREKIFKGASEVCGLGGIDIAIVITSLCGRTYCFAHPSVESVESQFLYQTFLAKSILEPYRNIHIEELYKQIDEVRKSLKVEEERTMILKKKQDTRPKKVWEDPIPKLSKAASINMKLNLRHMQAMVFNMLNKKFTCDQAVRGFEEHKNNPM